jgi:hypothetical protein
MPCLDDGLSFFLMIPSEHKIIYHQVDLNNKKMVQQYKSVYKATDYYLVGGEEMSKCISSLINAFILLNHFFII